MKSPPKEHLPTKKVLLLLANGFEAYEASVFTDVLGWSKAFGDIPVEVTTTGRHQKLKCTWNFTVIPEIQIGEVNTKDYDALAIPGGFEKAGFYEDAYHEDFLTLIRTFNEEKKIIASVCVGALPLGKSGILEGRKATTYHLLNGMRRKQLAEFGANVLDGHVVVDGNIITSSSPATALDVAIKLLEMLTSQKNCEKVKKWMGF
jgi:4-methyl-5(b-hydroxyethyl)-thiazole monophosphate biosynthesis